MLLPYSVARERYENAIYYKIGYCFINIGEDSSDLLDEFYLQQEILI